MNRRTKKKYKKADCIECNGEDDGFSGLWKMRMSKFFRKHYGGILKSRKAIDKKPLCLNCMYAYLEGGKAGFHPDYIKGIKLLISEEFREQKGFEKKFKEN